MAKRYKYAKELAEEYAIPLDTIKYHMREDGQLYKYVTSHNKIDTARNDVKKFIERFARPTVTDALENAQHLLPDASISMTDIVNKPFGEVVAQFGTDSKMKGWLDSIKKIEDIEEKRLKNQKAREEVVKRDLVEKYVFSYLNTIQSRLLNDLPKTLAIKVENAVNTRSTLEELENLIRTNISKHYRKAKQKIEGAISAE